MAKLYFRYGAMNSGKTTALLQVAHNYEERGQEIILVKPQADTKGDAHLVSRLGLSRKVDLTLEAHTNLRSVFTSLVAARGGKIAALLIDEAQFLSPEQVDQAMLIATQDNVPVLAYGIRTDFLTADFPGSRRLLAIAHSLEELKTICRCGKKAIFNARLVGGRFVFEGSQIAIDGAEQTYESMCAQCYLRTSAKVSGPPTPQPDSQPDSQPASQPDSAQL